ncbi:MAG: UDP-N-acetylmuramate dehydrogenase [Deltaproteobacteria bacterium]|nr:MAG: UDP-N-acetylmuramate dehydrogenase [Deltaproteobacteria bacterium]
MMRELKMIFRGAEGILLRQSPPFRKLTTIGTGGPARALVVPFTPGGLKEAVQRLSRAGVPYFTFGKGSNILVPDEGTESVAVWVAEGLTEVSFNGKGVTVEAGTTLPRAAVLAAASGLSGLEELAGIPGTVGGALVMNAGAFGREIGELVRWVELVTPEGETVRFERGDLVFEYRRTLFPVEGIVSRVCVNLTRGDRDAIFRRMRELNRERKQKQPWGEKTFGSVFKNPPGASAGKLLESAGLKGASVGDACVSKKHANFIVNRGRAKTRDVVALIELMRKKVREVHGVDLEPEVRRVA